MRIFVIHKGEDFDEIIRLKNQITEKINADILILESNSSFKSWKKEAKYKIRACDFVLYALGNNTHKSKNVDYEINYAIRKHKQIFLYELNPSDNYTINKTLFTTDSFTGNARPLFKKITLDNLTKILKHGYDFDIKETLEDAVAFQKDDGLIEQYKAYLETSEEVLNRRQTVSNFYTTLNTSLLTVASTIAGVIFGIDSIKNNYLVGCGIAIIISLVGILLCLNWNKLLDSYGNLNGAKIKVISQMEKSLYANIYDTEWKIMSEKLGTKHYVPFTKIEKRVPKIFIGVYILLVCVVTIFAVIKFLQ